MLYESLTPVIVLAVISVITALCAIAYDCGHARAWRDAQRAYEGKNAFSPFVSALKHSVDSTTRN